jgi:hypothetical protein
VKKLLKEDTVDLDKEGLKLTTGKFFPFRDQGTLPRHRINFDFKGADRELM